MSGVPVDAVSLITQYGVSIGVLVWFMFRMEKKMDEFTKAINELCLHVKGKTVKD